MFHIQPGVSFSPQTGSHNAHLDDFTVHLSLLTACREIIKIPLACILYHLLYSNIMIQKRLFGPFRLSQV
jgi:hypothetical protein